MNFTKKLFLFSIFLFFSCRSGGIHVNESDVVKYNGIKLSKSQSEKLADLLADLPEIKKKIYEKPTSFLIVTDESNQIAEYAVFFKEGFILKGDYLDAWTQRMEGKASVCYRLNDKTKNYLQQLEQTLE